MLRTPVLMTSFPCPTTYASETFLFWPLFYLHKCLLLIRQKDKDWTPGSLLLTSWGGSLEENVCQSKCLKTIRKPINMSRLSRWMIEKYFLGFPFHRTAFVGKILPDELVLHFVGESYTKINLSLLLLLLCVTVKIMFVWGKTRMAQRGRQRKSVWQDGTVPWVWMWATNCISFSRLGTHFIHTCS